MWRFGRKVVARKFIVPPGYNYVVICRLAVRCVVVGVVAVARVVFESVAVKTDDYCAVLHDEFFAVDVAGRLLSR